MGHSVNGSAALQMKTVQPLAVGFDTASCQFSEAGLENKANHGTTQLKVFYPEQYRLNFF